MQNSCPLTSKKCAPCEGKTHPLIPAEYETLLHELSGWEVRDGKKLWKEWEWKDFLQSIAFINHIAVLAEAEWHHPDLYLHDYRYLQVTLSTHAIGGLSENDFILAAKIDDLLAK